MELRYNFNLREKLQRTSYSYIITSQMEILKKPGWKSRYADVLVHIQRCSSVKRSRNVYRQRRKACPIFMVWNFNDWIIFIICRVDIDGLRLSPLSPDFISWDHPFRPSGDGGDREERGHCVREKATVCRRPSPPGCLSVKLPLPSLPPPPPPPSLPYTFSALFNYLFPPQRSFFPLPPRPSLSPSLAHFDDLNPDAVPCRGSE